MAASSGNAAAPMEQILKSVLKVGLKATTPLLGDVLVAAAEEGGGLLLDAHAAREAGRVQDRLLKVLYRDAYTAAKHGALPGERLSRMLPVAEEAVRHYGPTLDGLLETGFQPKEAAGHALKGVRKWLVSADPDDEAVLRVLLNTFYSTLLAEREILERTEARFRGAVLARLADLPVLIAHADERRAATALSLAAATLIALPRRRWRPGISPPGELLRADIEGAVPFHGRDAELADLEAWCDGSGHVGVRLYTGAGGMGKTRLLIELGNRLRTRSWRAGFLEQPDSKRIGPRHVPDELWRSLLEAPEPILIVVDYAETRRDELVPLLRHAFEAHDDRRIRIALLARAADDWWNQLKTERGGVSALLTGPRTRWISLGPLALDAERRRHSYHLATTTFARRLDQPEPPGVPADLADEIFERVLFLHMRALAAVDGVPVKGDQGILGHILNRERAFWAELLAARDLPAVLLPAVGQALAVLTLGGGASSRGEARAALRKVALLRDQPEATRAALAALLHDLYPGKRWIEPILPDLLGEHLIQEEATLDPEAVLGPVFGLHRNVS